MKVVSWDKDKSDNASDINIKSIEPLKVKYLNKIGGSSIKDISLLEANQLFLLVIGDFKKGVLSSDDLSAFGFEIFHGVAKHYPKSDLFQASLSASELVFSLRTKPAYINIPKYLEDIEKFYVKNK